MEFVVASDSPSRTEQAGRALALGLLDGDVVSLVGDLGAGKTVFARGVLRGLGVEAVVQSPTFVVERAYGGRLAARHLDLYRIEGDSALREIGIPERFAEGGVFLIEWGDRAAKHLPADHIHVAFSEPAPDVRSIRIRGPARVVEAMSAEGIGS
ncbi:MAG: tRNA (adenosine(37)-N6)-threonylcarbamoyltransferase complex ATPase subunit type 1 TsaE [bacterium]